MSTLERVMEMRQGGYTESQIIDALKGDGVSPKEIYNALTQSNIKSELSQKPMTTETEEAPQEQSQEGYYPEEAPQEQSQYSYPQPPNYNQGYQEYQAPQPATDIETINEIAEQITEEKTQEIKKQLSSFKNSNEEMKSDLERINKKLEKMENNFNELQVAILRKIGEYGENIKNISAEMHETQGSFSKILNPLTDNIRELQKLTGTAGKSTAKTTPKKEEMTKSIEETPTQEEPKKKTKPEPGFEEFLR